MLVHDFHLKSINCIEKINRERGTKRCLGKIICFNEVQLNIISIYNEYRFCTSAKGHPYRIIEIKKGITNSEKQV